MTDPTPIKYTKPLLVMLAAIAAAILTYLATQTATDDPTCPPVADAGVEDAGPTELDAGPTELDAGTASPTGGAMATGGHVHHTGGAVADAGTPTSWPYMPPVDESTIPTDGDPGLDVVKVTHTDEVPSVLSDGIGSFRVECRTSHYLFDDPIVFPGMPGRSHLHVFFGNKDADAHSTAESLLARGRSTCRGGIMNRSGYWVPATVDSEGKVQRPSHLLVYYKSGYMGVAPSEIKPLPQGIRMIAGGNPTEGKASPFIKYDCDVPGGPNHGEGKQIPTCKAGETLRAFLAFPQCWDPAQGLDSPDHRSHVAYATGKGCPASHPYAFPVITFQLNYPIPAGDDSGDWRLVSDMHDPALPGGWSYHGDVIAAWDETFEAEWLAGCVNAARDCHAHLLGPNRKTYF